MKKIIYLSAFLFSIISIANAQENDFSALVEEGIKLYDNGNYNGAIVKYEEALEIDPNSSWVNYEISMSYLATKEYKKAETYSKKVIDMKNGNELAAYITYGSALDMQGKTKKSIKAYETAMESYDHYLLYYNHAVSCFGQGDIDKAYISTIKGINNNSSHSSSHLLLSQIMERKGSRVKTVLPLYFFLLLEPNGSRAEVSYNVLNQKMNLGVSKSSEKNINVSVPNDKNPDFGAAEMMLSLTSASRHVEESQNKSKIELFIESNDSFFKILGELKKENTGFWWDFYIPFFYELAQEDLTEIYSYYISQTQGDEINSWLENHNQELEKFSNWLNN